MIIIIKNIIVITATILALLGTLYINYTVNQEHKAAQIKERAKELYIEKLEFYYIFKTKRLRIYMPIAIDKNANK